MAILSLAAFSAYGQKKGSNGTTLAAYKTLDICTEEASGNWTYSGVVAVWNEGAIDTEGFTLIDWIQNKVVGNIWNNRYPALNVSGTVIPKGTNQQTATTFSYSVTDLPLPGDIRNVATITITNHSGSLGTPKGPEPKATYTGAFPPPACLVDDPLTGCTRTQGYWGSKPNVVWPAPFDRNALFFLSGQTWQQVLDTPVNVSQGYYQLAHQYIAAVLNAASGASVPQGVSDTLGLATGWLTANQPSACTAGGSCGLQKDWAAVLNLYNNGLYPGGPPHCTDEVEP